MQFKKIIAVISCVVLLIAAVTVAPVSYPAVTASATTISQYKAKLDAAKAKSNAAKAKLSALKNTNATYEQKKAALNEQIAATQNEINLYQDQIAKCEKTISDRTAELDKNKKLFMQRLIAMYTASSSDLEVLLSAEDYGDYLAKAELIDTVTKKDTKLLQDIKDALNDLNEAKATLDDAKAEVDKKKSELVQQYNEVNAIVKKYNSQISNLQSDINTMAQEEKDIQAAITKAQNDAAAAAKAAAAKAAAEKAAADKAAAAANKNNQSSGGNKNPGSGSSSSISGSGIFAWPVPGYYVVSSKFGSRWGRNHNGIDIASNNGTVYGARIVAADSGTVILSKYYSGYGYCVIIDHGFTNGVRYTTLYGHMKAQSPLKVGDSVSKGSTTVGYVGASGNVTGPHLHFEIRANGSCVNPMNFY